MRLAERSGRAASAALPLPAESGMNAAVSGSPACDFCRGALSREERHRLVWESPVPAELVLAELCSRCATSAETLLELYGGRGRQSIALVQEVRPSARAPRVVGFLARGALYLLIALAFFLIVTLISSAAR
jgi:hypothetical protein